MNIEEAIELIHPNTSADRFAEIEYYGGFEGRKKAVAAFNEASLIACDVMEKYLGKKESYISQIRRERDIAMSQLNDYGVQFGEQADCVRVVRCKDCVYFDKFDGFGLCSMINDRDGWFENDFCSYGEHRDGE